VRETPDDPAAAWDRRVGRALARAPAPLRQSVTWLREPARRWLRIPAGLLLILGGVLSILPILGLWMLPLGLALLGEDFPPLKARLEAIARWVERRWRHLRG
jgi:hypothetical protein